MRTLAEDREEVESTTECRWVARRRREYGIKPGEAACWMVQVEQDRVNGKDVYESHTVWFGRSPGDALSYARAYAGHARQDGTGRWTLEVYGEEGNTPQVLVVVPHLDEEYDS